MSLTHSAIPKVIAFLSLGIVGFLFIIGIQLSQVATYDLAPRNFWGSERLLTNVDGYYYLRHARDWLHDQYSADDPLRFLSRPAAPPLLSKLTAYGQKLTGHALMEVGFFLPVLLAGLSAFLYMAYGQYLGSMSLGFLAALFSTTSHIWLLRCRIGWLDTDCLNSTLAWGMLLTLAFAAQSKTIRAKLFFYAATLSIAALLIGWWPTGAFPFIGIAVAVYTATLFVPDQSHWEKRVKMGLILCGLVLLSLVATGYTPDILPIEIRKFIHSLQKHLTLSMKQSSTLFPEVGSIISELGVFPVGKFIHETGGHWGVTVIALIGLVHMGFTHRQSIYYIIMPGLIFSALSFTGGNRFIMFIIPAQALGLAWFCIRILYAQLGKVNVPMAKAYLIAFTLILLTPGLTYSLSERVEPIVDANMAQLFTETGKALPPDALLWNQWSAGYAMQYFANRRTFIDGGSQSPELVWISEVPFASANETFSINWIYFFSKHKNAIRKTQKRLQTTTKETLVFLKKALKNKSAAENALKELGITEGLNKWFDFLFPNDAETALVFTSDMLFRTIWVSKGLWDPETDHLPKTPLFLFPYNELQVDRKEGHFIFDGKTYPYSKLVLVTADSLGYDPIRKEGPVAILVEGNKNGFMIQQEYFNNLGFRLLFVHPANTIGFKPLGYHPYIGGGWKVLRNG